MNQHNTTNIFVLIGLTICLLISPNVLSSDTEHYVSKLRNHYKSTPALDVFSLNYHYLGGGNPYQSWDVQLPERYIALRMVELDLVKEHFVENDIHHFPNGVTFNRVQFQNDKESLFYDRNGLALGKRIIKQSMESFDEIKGHVFMNLDFLAVTPLLEETDVERYVTVLHDKASQQTTVTHKRSKDNIIAYVFNNAPFSLAKINKISQQKSFIYSDYQTTNGYTYARSILKYYDNNTRPTFVHRIGQLSILDKIDPSKFKVPAKFGPIIPESDEILQAQKIAKDLYLVNDSAAWRNVLFKVVESEIMVFGAPIDTAQSEQTIQLIQSKFPKKTITKVYVTHPHSDHIDGLLAYTAIGATVLADLYTIKAIKAYPPFKAEIANFQFEIIAHNQIIDGARFYVLESPHSKRESFVHFENLGIIYQADFLKVPFDNTVAQIVPSSTKIFVDFVRDKQLKFNRIVGHHRNPNISVEIMNKNYDAFMWK